MSNIIQFPTVEKVDPRIAELDKEVDNLLERFTKEEVAVSMMRLMGEAYEENTEVDND